MTDVSNSKVEKPAATDGFGKFRSPPFPYTTLERAIERATQLWSKAAHHPMSFKIAAQAWDMTEKSSALAQTVGSLNHYGLITDDGSGDSRRIRVSERAQRIIRDPIKDSPKRFQAIQDAALEPKVFRELWDTYGTAQNLDDAVLLSFLTLERQEAGKAPFSDTAAVEVVRLYRDTIAYAKLLDSDKEGEAGNAPDDTKSEVKKPAQVAETKGGQQVAAPETRVKLMAGERELTTGLLSKDSSFRLIVSGHIGAKEIDRLIQKLALDKEILAEPDAEDVSQFYDPNPPQQE